MHAKLLQRAEGARVQFFQRPLPYLALHFFTRFFESELVSGDGDNSVSVGGIFAILAVPGLLAPLFLFAKYSSFVAWMLGHPRLNVWQLSLSDQYLLITAAMTVTGIATVIKWDSLFPDRTDFAALAPLPLTAAHIFTAKIAALAALLFLFVVDVNGASALLFPMVFLAGYGTFAEYVRFTAIHMLAIGAASCFVFLLFLAIAGLFLTLVPPRWFARVSRYVRTVAVVALLVLLLTGFAVSDAIMAGRYSGVVKLLPPVWFVGMARALFGRPAYPVFHQLAQWAGWSLLITLLTAAAAYALSYRRYFVRIPESVDAPAGSYGRLATTLWELLDRLLPGNPFERACAMFALKTVARSEKHWLMLGAYLGLALTIAAGTAVLAIPLIVVFFLISGLRFVFALPSELRANWLFQVCAEPPCDAGRRVAKRVMLVLTAPFLVVCVPIYAAAYGIVIAVAHIAFVALVAAILADILLADCRSIPFTCSWAPGKGNPAFSIALYAGAFFIVASLISSLERWMLLGAVRYAIAMAAIVWVWQYWRRESSKEPEPLLYEDRRDPAVQTLNLS